MNGVRLLLKYFNSVRISKGERFMDIAAYFTLLQYALMGVVLIVLVLIFLHVLYGKEEDEPD
jgi:hypothetical protein